MAKKIDIGGELHSVATDHKVADASEIKDISKGNKSQTDFNNDIDRHEVEIHGTGGIDSRLTDVEQIEQIVLDGGEVQIAQGSDFTNPDATKRAKVPTVGAIVDGLNDGIYDVSKRNPTGGPNSDGKFTLDYILDNANTLIPIGWRHGGMTISFVQSSDNNYIQARLMANAFTTDIAQWQVVDKKPTNYSKNLVESEGVYDEFGFIPKNITLTSADFAGVFDNNGTIANATATYNGLVFKLYPNCKYKFPNGVTVQNSYPKAGDTRDNYYAANTEITVDSIKYGVLSVAVASFVSFTYYQKGIGCKKDIAENKDAINNLEVLVGTKTMTYTSNDFSGLFNDNGIVKASTSSYNGIVIRLLKGITYSINSGISIIKEYPTVGALTDSYKAANTEFSVLESCYGIINAEVASFTQVTVTCASSGLTKDIENIKNETSIKIGFESHNIILTSNDYSGVYDNGTTIVAANSTYNGIIIPLYPGCKYRFANGITVQNSFPKIGDTRDNYYAANTLIEVETIKYGLFNVTVSSFSSITYYQKGIGNIASIKANSIDENSIEKEVGVSTQILTSSDFAGLYNNNNKIVAADSSYNGVVVRLLKGVTYKATNGVGIVSEYPIVGSIVDRYVSSNTEFTVDNNCYGVINAQLSNFSSVSLICNSTGIKKDIEELQKNSASNIVTKNLLQSSLVTSEHNGITFTVNSDGSIVCTGTATGNGAVGVLCNGYHLDAGKYIISGFPKNSDYHRPHLVVYPPYISGGTHICDDYIFEVTQEYVDRVQIYISVPTGFVCNGDEFSTFRPMVRKYDEKDGTYIKYGATPKVNIPISAVVNTSLFSWYNKKIVVLGDSIALGKDGDWIAKSSVILGLGSTKNYGIGGSRMAYYGDGGSVTADDSVVAKVSEIDADADIILIHAGTNDSASQVPLGSVDSVDRLEFNGALNIIMSYIREHHPYALVIFDTIMDRYNYDNSSIYPIGQSQYSECIKNMCTKYHFLCWDIYKELGVDVGWDYSNQNYNYTIDGLHPNNKLSNIMARKFSAFVNNH